MVTKVNKEASRLRADGKVELTGATGEDGILVERVGREAVLEYQERRRQQIAEAKAQAEEKRRYERFEEAFTNAGGTKADAEAAYKAHKNQRAAEAAGRADEAARRAYEGAMKGALPFPKS